MKNVTGRLTKYVLLAVVLGSFSGCSSVDDDIDLNRVLDVTLDTLTNYSDELDIKAKSPDSKLNSDDAFLGFAGALASNYNNAQPPLYNKGQIGVSAGNDAALLAYADTNLDQKYDKGEEALFLIEIDGENSRIIATSRSGAVSDHHFSGTGLMAGFLIGSMLSRQRSAGVNTKSLATKKTVTSKQAARSRAGSGSHSKGK